MSSSCKGKNVEEVKTRMEEDAKEILNFMALNGLVTNPKKTSLLIINNKQEEKVEVTVGNVQITQEKHKNC